MNVDVQEMGLTVPDDALHYTRVLEEIPEDNFAGALITTNGELAFYIKQWIYWHPDNNTTSRCRIYTKKMLKIVAFTINYTKRPVWSGELIEDIIELISKPFTDPTKNVEEEIKKALLTLQGDVSNLLKAHVESP